MWISLVLTQCKGCFSSHVKKKISFVIFKNRICYCFEIQENFVLFFHHSVWSLDHCWHHLQDILNYWISLMYWFLAWKFDSDSYFFINSRTNNGSVNSKIICDSVFHRSSGITSARFFCHPTNLWYGEGVLLHSNFHEIVFI